MTWSRRSLHCNCYWIFFVHLDWQVQVRGWFWLLPLLRLANSKATLIIRQTLYHWRPNFDVWPLNKETKTKKQNVHWKWCYSCVQVVTRWDNNLRRWWEINKRSSFFFFFVVYWKWWSSFNEAAWAWYKSVQCYDWMTLL